jgi:hypothetical protein
VHVRRVSASFGLSAAILIGLATPFTAQAAAPTVECGQLSGYTAPDPAGPTDGSLQLGLLPAWVIAATATIAPAAATALPSGVNNGPTCLAVERDPDDQIASIDFAAQGTIAGHVTVDSGSGFYLLADRLLIPTAITDAYPTLGALFPTSERAGSILSVTFTIDSTTGGFTGFDGAAAFCGAGSLTAAGDGKVGAAIIPKAVLDAADRSALKKAAGQRACATVRSVGTIGGSGVVDTTSDVRITVADAGGSVPLPPTDAVAGPVVSTRSGSTLAAWMTALTLVALAAISRRRRSEGEAR